MKNGRERKGRVEANTGRVVIFQQVMSPAIQFPRFLAAVTTPELQPWRLEGEPAMTFTSVANYNQHKP
jgi:hypothetical protein